MGVNVNEMPKLGFGLMRLPEKEGQIDLDQVCRMVDLYMEAGLNYFDTAYVYHGGKSEAAAREAIVKRYPRESFRIATKLPAWEMKVWNGMNPKTLYGFFHNRGNGIIPVPAHMCEPR